MRSKNKFIQMKKEIKIGDKTFEFESPNILDKSTTDMMNDWCRLIEQQKSNEVNTKQEIEIFYEEFREKTSKIHNQFINLELSKIDGYLRGLYKQYQDLKN